MASIKIHFVLLLVILVNTDLINSKNVIKTQDDDNSNIDENLLLINDIKSLLHKLEGYAIGEEIKTVITVDELKAAYNEYYNKLNDSARDELINRQPLVRLLADLLMKPMQDNPELISYIDGEDSTASFHNDYITRLKLFYERFRPCYLGIKKSTYIYIVPKLRKLLRAYEGKLELNKKLILDAKKDVQAIRRRVEDILTFEDLFASADEFEALMNVLNTKEIRLSEEVVFPKVTDDLEESEIDIKLIEELFFDEMYKSDNKSLMRVYYERRF